MRTIFLLIVTLTYTSACTAPPCEWAGIFTTPNTKYVWTAQKKAPAAGGDPVYADATMDFVVRTATAATDAALDAEATAGNTQLACSTPTVVNNGGSITPSTTACYRLTFDNDFHTTSFSIDNTGAYTALFAQHVPTEFERNTHYLQDTLGEDIEPAHTLPEAAATHTDKPWGEAFGATILVCLTTLIGVVFATPCFDTCVEEQPETLYCMSNSFAAGALLAAAFYLMVYEATHLIKYTDEAVATCYWGTFIILGFITSQFIELIMSAVLEHVSPKPTAESTPQAEVGTNMEKIEAGSGSGSGNGTEAADPQGVDTELAVVEQPQEKSVTAAEALEVAEAKDNQLRVLCGVLVGDFMHNLVDGIVIGAAFLGCSDSMAWGITGATIAHEIGQEIADYFVLTDPKLGGLTPVTALGLNFISGLSVILGAIIILAQDSVDNYSQGLLLAYGGGVYIQIAASECMPRALKYAKTMTLRVASFCMFIFGCFAIGIILLKHEHCVPSGAAHAH